MKISKKRLLQIIKEELADSGKFTAGSLSTSGYKTAALAGVEAGEEFTSQERHLVNQMQELVTQIASVPDVELTKYKAAIERAMKYLTAAVGLKPGEIGNQEEEL